MTTDVCRHGADAEDCRNGHHGAPAIPRMQVTTGQVVCDCGASHHWANPCPHADDPGHATKVTAVNDARKTVLLDHILAAYPTREAWESARASCKAHVAKASKITPSLLEELDALAGPGGRALLNAATDHYMREA